MNYNQQLAEKIQNSGFLKDYPLKKENVLGQTENHPNNNLILSDALKNVNHEFEQNFKGTGYLTKNNCTYRISTKNNNRYEQLLCNFVAWIEQEVTVDDGLEVHKVLKISGKHMNNYNLPCIDVPENDFINLNWVIKKWGARCILETGQSIKDNIRCCIQKISKNITSKTVFRFTGWKKLNGLWIYLHSGGAVGADNIEVILDGRLAKYKLPDTVDFCRADLPAIIDEFSNLAPKKIVITLLALVFLTPLNEFLKRAGHEPNFICYLLGKTGCGKSTLSALFLSFFGSFSGTDLPMSFLDTPNSIVNKAFTIKDSLICIDDYKPSNRSDILTMDKTAQQLVRSFGERTGRQRLNSDSSDMAQKYPRGNAILTGEQLPNIGESGTSRMLILELKSSNINFDQLSHMQLNAKNNIYSGMMKIYIMWLKNSFLDNHQEIFISLLSKDFQSFRNYFLKILNVHVHPRIPSTLAFLKIGYKYLLEFLNLESNHREQKLKAFDDILITIAKEHSEVSLSDKPTFEFISALKDMITGGIVRVTGINSTLSATNDNKPLIGYYDDKFYYFLPKVTYNQVCRFYCGHGENFSITQNALLKQLAEEGFISSEKGRNTLVKKINNNIRSRFIWFYKRNFDDFGCMSENEVTEVPDNDK